MSTLQVSKYYLQYIIIKLLCVFLIVLDRNTHLIAKLIFSTIAYHRYAYRRLKLFIFEYYLPIPIWFQVIRCRFKNKPITPLWVKIISRLKNSNSEQPFFSNPRDDDWLIDVSLLLFWRETVALNNFWHFVCLYILTGLSDSELPGDGFGQPQAVVVQVRVRSERRVHRRREGTKWDQRLRHGDRLL